MFICERLVMNKKKRLSISCCGDSTFEMFAEPHFKILSIANAQSFILATKQDVNIEELYFHKPSLAWFYLDTKRCRVRRGYRFQTLTAFDAVDLGGIEPPPPQCECGVLPLNYRPSCQKL